MVITKERHVLLVAMVRHYTVNASAKFSNSTVFVLTLPQSVLLSTNLHPAHAGRTDNSASSTSSITSAQAEAETLKLCQHSLAGRAGPGTSQDARPGLDDEPTVVVNRSLGRLTGTSTLSSLRQGPRRLGECSPISIYSSSQQCAPLLYSIIATQAHVMSACTCHAKCRAKWQQEHTPGVML